MTSQTPLWAQFLIGLIGGLIGGVASYVSTRSAKAISRAELRAAQRTELREAIYDFIHSIQDAEEFLDLRDQMRKYPNATRGLSEEQVRRYINDAPDRTHHLHAMWRKQKNLAVSGTEELQNRSYAYVVKMRSILFDQVPQDQTMWQYMDPEKEEFLRVARTELDAKADR